MAAFYVDASALVKLVRNEVESAPLRSFIGGADLVSSELVLSEVPRAVRRAVAGDASLELNTLLDRADRLLGLMGLRPVDEDLLTSAGAISEPALRALDAIHVVTAVLVSPTAGFITYDQRQAAAARLAGLRTVAPGV